MSEPLVLAVAQPVTVAHDIPANAAAHAAAVRAAAARVVAFPELSLTGYEYDAEAIAPDDPRLSPIVEACVQTGACALVGAPVADGDGRHIGVLLLDGSGARVAYRKTHLGAREAESFVPGPGPVLVEVDGWALGLAVCRDSGFAKHAAGAAALGMDAYVVGILEAAEDAAVVEERARRIAHEHGVWVAMASFAGAAGTDFPDAAGGSGIWAPDGTAADRVGREPGAVARASLTR